MKKKIAVVIATILMVCMIVPVLVACPSSSDARYTLRYDKGDANAKGNTPALRSYMKGETVRLDFGSVFTLEGYDFDCWFDGNDDIEEGEEYIMPGRNVTLTAKWKEYSEDSIAVIYDANGGTGNTPAIKHFSETDDIIISDQGQLTRDGYTFLGWTDGYTNFENNTRYSMSDIVNTLAREMKEVTLRARWRRNANEDIQGHWIKGTALSGPEHDHEAVDGLERYVERTASVKYWITNKKPDTNHLSLVVYNVVRLADGEGTYKGEIGYYHDVYNLKRVSEDKNEFYDVDTERVKVIKQGSTLMMWIYNTPGDSDDDASYYEFDEQATLGKENDKIKGVFYNSLLRAQLDLWGYDEETGWFTGTYITYLGDEMISFVVICDFVGEYIVMSFTYYVEDSGAYATMYQVFWQDSEGLPCTFYGSEANPSDGSFKFLKIEE